jgi:septal ring factor EnvC (AmiA/AmiB activator)
VEQLRAVETTKDDVEKTNLKIISELDALRAKLERGHKESEERDREREAQAQESERHTQQVIKERDAQISTLGAQLKELQAGHSSASAVADAAAAERETHDKALRAALEQSKAELMTGRNSQTSVPSSIHTVGSIGN